MKKLKNNLFYISIFIIYSCSNYNDKENEKKEIMPLSSKNSLEYKNNWLKFINVECPLYYSKPNINFDYMTYNDSLFCFINNKNIVIKYSIDSIRKSKFILNSYLYYLKDTVCIYLIKEGDKVYIGEDIETECMFVYGASNVPNDTFEDR